MNKKFYIYMFIAMTLWSGSWVSGKLLSAGSFLFQFIFWRFIITAFLYLIIHLYVIKKDKSYTGMAHILKKPYLIIMLVFSALALTGYNFMFIHGLTAGLAGKGGVIVTSLNPLFGFIIGALIYRNKFTLKNWIGMTVGLIGGIILIDPWKYSVSQLIDGGNLIFVAAAGFWALITALGHKVQKEISLWEFNLLIYTIAIFITIPLIWSKDILNFQQYTSGFWLNTFFLAIFAGTIAGGIYFYASKTIGSAKTGSFTFIVPVMAMFFSYIFLKEIPEPTTIIGGALAVSAVYIINSRGTKKNK
jgi:drug/metabolite transporter (DMT)-like permease